MSRKITFAPDEFYHLYNRGIDRRIIFRNDNDRNRFVALLYLCNSNQSFHFQKLPKNELFMIDRKDTLIDILAYCLMNNHFHILAKEKTDNGISTFMHKLATAYTMYFNKINERKGRLFETNFQARHIDSDQYLQYVNAYIHLNPIKIIEPEWKKSKINNQDGAKNFLNNYNYSSYLDYLNYQRPESNILNRSASPHFEEVKEFSDYLNDWLNYSQVEA